MDAMFQTAKDMIIQTILRYVPHQPERDGQVEEYIQNLLDPSSERRELWTDIRYSTEQGACLTALYKRINTLAVAYRNPKSGFHLDARLLDAVRRALRSADRYWYHEWLTMAGYDNWWHFTIGVPEQYSSALSLIWDGLNEEEKQRYTAALEHFCDYEEYCCVTPKGTAQRGANLVNISTYEYRMGVLAESQQKVAHALAEFAKVFSYVDCQPDKTLVDGFYSDGSFLQHGVPYNANYGREFLGGVIRFFETTAGTEWELAEDLYQTVNEWIDRGIAPFIFRASAMDLVSGRAIVRKRTDKTYGYELGRYILHYASLLHDPVKQTEYFAMVKGWFLSSSTLENPPLSWETDCDALSRSIIDNPGIRPDFSAGTGIHIYPNMDRAVHRPSPEWAFGLSMFSSRIPSYELTNGENVQGWYIGSGMTSLYLADDIQYTDDYWWTVDMTAIPGTTVAAQPRYRNEYQDGDGEGYSTKAFVGGAGLKGCGVAAMQLEQLGTPDGVSLEANKSWFLFRNEIVCLGSGITGASDSQVYTTVENRRVTGEKTEGHDRWRFGLDGNEVLLSKGIAQKFEGVRFAWLRPDEPGSEIGYYFPHWANIEVHYESRRGDPGDSCLRQTKYHERPVRSFVKMQLPHGNAPVNDTYSYVLLPGMSFSRTARYATHPEIMVVRQEKTVHAVYHATDCLLGIANFSDRPVSVQAGHMEVRLDKAIVLLVQEDGTVAVSDPARKQVGNVTVTLEGRFDYVKSARYSAIYEGGCTVITFYRLAKEQGGTVTAYVI